MNAAAGRSYRRLNIISLWMIAEARQFSSATWAKYQQWQERGAQVRKGEKSASVFFWKNLREAPDRQPADGQGQAAWFVARAYNVFNADQVDGYEAPLIPILAEEERIAAADSFFGSIPAKVEYGGGSACYAPSVDMVRMPEFGSFRSAKGFYSVLGHELTHRSGAKTRLDRDLSGRFGSESYAMEDLAAELGAPFIAGQLGLPSVPRTDHASYIASWLRAAVAPREVEPTCLQRLFKSETRVGHRPTLLNEALHLFWITAHTLGLLPFGEAEVAWAPLLTVHEPARHLPPMFE